MLVLFLIIVLVSATAVFGVTFWSYGSLVAFVLAIFCANALLFALAVMADPRRAREAEEENE